MIKPKLAPEPELSDTPPIDALAHAVAPNTQILVDFNRDGKYDVIDIPPATIKERVMLVNGRSVEHVDEDRHGRWRYRQQ